MPLSPKFPLIIGPAQTGVSGQSSTQGYQTFKETSIQDQGALVKFHLKNILLSCPGDHLGNLDMGCCLKQFLFTQETGGAEFDGFSGGTPGEKIANLIREQVGIFAPYINITDVDVFAQEQTLVINIFYFVNFTGANSISDAFNIIIDHFGNVSSNNQINTENASFDAFGDNSDYPSAAIP